MTYDTGFGILSGQFFKKSIHRCLLGLSPSIDRMAGNIKTAFVANTERAAVVVAGMGTADILGEDRDDGTIATDVVVIGGLAKAGIASGDQAFD